MQLARHTGRTPPPSPPEPSCNARNAGHSGMTGRIDEAREVRPVQADGDHGPYVASLLFCILPVFFLSSQTVPVRLSTGPMPVAPDQRYLRGTPSFFGPTKHYRSGYSMERTPVPLRDRSHRSPRLFPESPNSTGVTGKPGMPEILVSPAPTPICASEFTGNAGLTCPTTRAISR